MDSSWNDQEEWSGCDMIGDLWEPYRGKYPEPTHRECHLIRPFLYKFDLEDDNFVEHQNELWIFFKNHLGSPPNLRSQLIQFLAQVRATKGYGVDTYFDFSVVSAWEWERLHVFIPRNLADLKFYRQAMAASNFAIRKINARTGKDYVVLSVEKLVSTTTNKLLLTFTAAYQITTVNFEIFQAMLSTTDATTFQLEEWKFKPVPIEQL